jgi:hypothetical protein
MLSFSLKNFCIAVAAGFTAILFIGSVFWATQKTENISSRQRDNRTSFQKPFQESSPAQGTPGKVTVVLTQSAYTQGQVIEATVVNGLTQVIYTEDSKSDCSIAILEEWDRRSWQPRRGCIARRPPNIVPIGPAQAKMIVINPFSTHFGINPGAVVPALGPGRYRLKLTYRLAPEPEGEEPNTAYSAVFEIRP